MSEEQFRELKRKCVPVMVVTLTMVSATLIIFIVLLRMMLLRC